MQERALGEVSRNSHQFTPVFLFPAALQVELTFVRIASHGRSYPLHLLIATAKVCASQQHLSPTF
jgi:hypothetical protein